MSAPESAPAPSGAGAAAPHGAAPDTEGPREEAAPEGEARLWKLLEEMTACLRRGGEVDLEAEARAHPDLAGELRQLWPAVALAEEASRSSGTAAAEPTAGRPPRPPPAGTLPRRFGGYELLEELGRGAMGVVYRAREVSLGRTVALKMMLTGAHASPETAERFRREAEAAARLEHPAIAAVHHVGETEGLPFFTMQCIEGRTLGDLLREGPLPAREAARILAGVARAVDFAHRQGVLHRDLKPSNILLDLEGQPHVTDFGLARRLEAPSGFTRTGAVVGTPGYMSPEQAAGSRGSLGPASDVYGLGAVLYHCLTGRPPFQAPTAMDAILRVLEEDPLPPRLLNPRADRELELVALKCLQKPRELRYPSAAALAQDLEAYLAGEPVSARKSGLRLLASRLLRETHHAVVLENWGLLWMWHSAALVALCLATSALQWSGVNARGPYLALWTVGFGAWALFFWNLRRRSGPITFVERQIAHVWGASIVASVLLFVLEMALDLPVLSLSPVLGVISGMVFFIKAGILSGSFYLQAGALFLTSLVMTVIPSGAVALFGLVNAACFFVPGLKYRRQRRRSPPPERPDPASPPPG